MLVSLWHSVPQLIILVIACVATGVWGGGPLWVPDAVGMGAALPGGGTVRIVGRRPATGGDVRWTIVFESGLHPHDPGMRAQAEQILEDLRRQTGL